VQKVRDSARGLFRFKVLYWGGLISGGSLVQVFYWRVCGKYATEKNDDDLMDAALPEVPTRLSTTLNPKP